VPSSASARNVADLAHFGGDASCRHAGRRAIEVARHADRLGGGGETPHQPRGGKLSALTIALFAAGAIAVLAAVYASSPASASARDNKRALHEWVEVEKQPAIDFRPERLNPASTPSRSSASSPAWAPSSGRSCARSTSGSRPYFRIGSDPGVEFPTEPPGEGVVRAGGRPRRHRLRPSPGRRA
jgi:hypothetical protein